MALAILKNSVKELEEALVNLACYKLDSNKKPDNRIGFSLKISKADSYKSAIARNMNFLKRKVWDLMALGSVEPNRRHLLSLLVLVDELDRAYNSSDFKRMIALLEDVDNALDSLKDVPQQSLSFSVSNLHPEIKGDVDADLEELRKCYESRCYRSVVIICGRILETALHRKYYEITGNDALEKSPGVGLGKLVAKLSEKDVKFDPGLTQQIHLINQVRVFSVHKKQEPFYPTQMQAYAITLFTLDILKKIF